MARVVVDVDIDSKDAVREVEKLSSSIENIPVDETTKGFKDMGDAITASTKNGVESVGELGSSVNSLKAPQKAAAGGFKAIGTAIKAAGIGLVVAAVAALSAAMRRNRKIADGLTVVFNTIAQVTDQIVTALVNTATAVASNTERFDALAKVIKGLLTLGITPLKLQFLAIKLAIQEARLAWESSFFGGQDEDTIAELRLSIGETRDSLVEAGKAALQSGKDIVSNFGEAVGEIGDIGSTAIENLSQVSLNAAIEQAKANKLAEDSSIIAQAQSEAVIAQKEREAEIQRKIRDNEFNSIKERIAANDRLGEILKEQQDAEIALAEAVVAGAAAQLQKNKGVEEEAELIRANAQLLEIKNRIESQSSEQEINRTQLLKEQYEITQSVAQSEVERARNAREFAAEQIENDQERILAQIENLRLSRQEALAAKDAEIAVFKEGTLARAQAEQERLDILQEFKQKEIQLNKELNDQKKADNKALSDANKEIDQAEFDAKQATLGAVGSLVRTATNELGEATEAGKGLAAAGALIDSYASISGTLSAFSKVPVPGYAIAQAIATGAVGLAQVRKILSVNVPGGGGGGGGSVGSISAGGGTANFSGVDFSFLGDGDSASASEFQSLDQDQQTTRGVRAYVASTDITDQQNLDQKVTELASLNGD